MPSTLVYQITKDKIGDGQFDWSTLDLRFLPVNTAQSGNDPKAAGEEDRNTLSAFFGGTGIAAGCEYNGTGTPRTILANKLKTRVQASDLIRLTADDHVFAAAQSTGSHTQVDGVLVYVHVTDDTDSWPVCYIEFPTAKAPPVASTSQLTITWHADGILQIIETAFVFNRAMDEMAAGNLDLVNDDIRSVLIADPVETGNDPTAAGEEDRDTLSAFFAGTGIAAGAEFDGTGTTRPVLANKTHDRDDATDTTEFMADNVQIGALDNDNVHNAVGGVLIYKHVTTDADSYPICYVKYEPPEIPNGGAFNINWPAAGILSTS